MKIVFTICSNNYLAQAHTLGVSLQVNNPECRFIIGLVDRKRKDVDYLFETIEVEDIDINDFESLWKKFSIIELNTAVKPFYFLYFLKKYKNIKSILYLDPDTKIFSNISQIFEKIYSCNALITPHILTPIEKDNYEPKEQLFLKYGIYNLGFIGVSSNENVYQILKWWAKRTYDYGFNNTSDGLFVDQLWINFLPIFFDNIQIESDPGINMAPWNLHERKIHNDNGILYVNKKHILKIYHFSSYKPLQPELIATSYNRYSFDKNPELIPLYEQYRKQLLNNGYATLSNFGCVYLEMKESYEQYQKNIVRHGLLKFFMKRLNFFKKP